MIAFYASARGLQKGEAVPVITLTSAAANVTAISGGILVFGDPMPNYTLGIVDPELRLRARDRGGSADASAAARDARHRLAPPHSPCSNSEMRHALACLGLLLCVAGWFAVARPAGAAFPGANGRIVFVTDRAAPGPAGREIYTTNADGSDPLRADNEHGGRHRSGLLAGWDEDRLHPHQ